MVEGFMDYPAMLDVVQAAEMLGVSEQTIRRMISRNDLPSVRVGRLIRIPKQKALEKLENHVGG